MAEILAVDDEGDILFLLELLLEDSGYDVRTATSATAGLAAYRDARPDLILLDMMLPELSGVDFLALLVEQSETPLPPIIGLSAHTQPAAVQRMIDAGISVFVRKPFDDDHLLATIAEHLANPPAHDLVGRLDAAEADPQSAPLASTSPSVAT